MQSFVTQDFRVENANLLELDFFMEQAANEGWNPGYFDCPAFYQIDPKGLFLGKLNGKTIGCISAVAYDKTFGFIGFYIVTQQYRHQGYGIKLWQRAIEHLGERNIGLDGVVAQQENYKRSGFKLAYKNIRFKGCLKGFLSQKAVPLDQIPFQTILDYDKQCFPVPRENFLKAWLMMPNAKGYGIVINNKLVGYGLIRNCVKDYKIGPLFADTIEIAEELLQSLCTHTKECMFYLDIPEVNKKAVELVNKFKMEPVFETARMYTKEPPKTNMNKIFGLTTFEVG